MMPWLGGNAEDLYWQISQSEAGMVGGTAQFKATFQI